MNLSERYWMKYILPRDESACFQDTLFVSSNPDTVEYGHLGPLPLLYPECFAFGGGEMIALQENASVTNFFKGDILWVDDYAKHGISVSHWPADTASLAAFSLHPLADGTLPTEAQVAYIRSRLRDALPFTVDVAYFPMNAPSIKATGQWASAIPVATRPAATNGLEVYNPGVAVGHLRILSLSELDKKSQDGTIGYQDIVALWEAPPDMERLVGGIVTQTQQGELSHLNLRAIARGIPNCYQASFDWLLDYQDKLVRLECTTDGLTIDWATPAEAEQHWKLWRPAPVSIPTIDDTHAETPALGSLPVTGADEQALALTRYGAKAVQLATVYAHVPSDHQLPGFAIPFSYYEAFLSQTTATFDWGNGPETLSLRDAIQALLDDPMFQSDGGIRASRLDQLRDAIRDAPVDPALIGLLSNQIQTVFGDPTTMVRFRSSSNAEDDCRFSGAGLYDSTSVCLADELDDDDDGPSLCDPEQAKERTVKRGLRKVWKSLWNLGAYEERDWFGIDHSQASMAILVNARSQGEQANIVAFSGNPWVPDDHRYLINAQVGELDVVSSEPGLFPEATYLTLSDGGSVTGIERIRGSSELSADAWVLPDSRLEELGGLFWNILQKAPPPDAPPGTNPLADTEWKVLSDGRLIIKQFRTLCLLPTPESNLGLEWH